jgi:dTDP-4-dehydrorhamnose 3,5-epimerase
MKLVPTAIPDVQIIESDLYRDDRGFFMETFNLRALAVEGIAYNFVQDNHSGSHRGTLRGLHYQAHQAQGKIVRTVVGEVFDVAVDIRRSSPTFGKWVGTNLSADNKLQVWIPPGFAHGFYVLSDWAEIAYKVTDYYAAEWERTLLWNDRQIGIEWPIIDGIPINISTKDLQGKSLHEADLFD